MNRPSPRVGVPSAARPELPESLRASGAEPVPLPLPPVPPPGGVALAREWTADAAEILCADADLDALLLDAASPAQLFGMLLAAVRLDLPTVCAAPAKHPLGAALTALGLAPVARDAAEVAAEVGARGGPRPGELLENFSLANGLRAGISAGGGPELLVHLCALARESGVAGFGQMVRVLAPETEVPPPGRTEGRGVSALLASLGESLHDVPTVSGNLRGALPEALPKAGSLPPGGRRYVFVRARASGAEAVCLAPIGVSEVAGRCRVFLSEEEAVRAVDGGRVGEDEMVVVSGGGPRGGPGLRRLDKLGAALREGGPRVPVLTDGTSPEDAPGVWASLFTPEAAAGGIMGRLRDGDALRLDLEGGLIRTGVRPEEFRGREARLPAAPPGAGYVARYARSALPALEGAGFG